MKKKEEQEIFSFELITILFLILNVFVKNILNYYYIFVFVVILLIITKYLFGFEKNKLIQNDSKKASIVVTFFTMSFLIITYGIGLFAGFVKSPYNFDVLTILKNTFPVALLLISVELLRFNICRKSNHRKLLYLMAIAMFTILDILIAVPSYNLNDYEEILKLLTLVAIPSITKNIMLSNFTCNYGAVPPIIYQLIMNLYVFLIPIYPNLSLYLESVIMFLLPLIIKYVTNLSLQPKKEERELFFTKNRLVGKITTGVTLVLILIIISLYSNLFPYWIAVVGTGSMTPTINVGDAIVVDKTVKDNLDRLKEGDILVFKIQDSIYTHRIVDIKKENETYYIATKGDRKGQVVDNWTVTNNDVVGVVKFKIPYIGYPTVFLNRFLKENK